MFSTDTSFVIRSWDPWIAEITHIDAVAAIGRSLFDLFPDIVERGLAPRLTHVVVNDAGGVLSAAFHQYLLPCTPRVPSPNFTRMQQHVTLSPLRENDATTGIIITIEDITDRLDRERELAQTLHSDEEPRRLEAAQTLARDSAQPEILVDAFGDESWRVRQAAVAGFAQRSGEEVTAALTRALREQHTDLAVVNSTLSALAISGKDILPQLLGYLTGPDQDLRIYVALALGIMTNERAAPALLKALSDDNINVRFHAIEALGRIRSRSAAGRLAAIAATGDFFLGFAALEALALIGDSTVVPTLLPLLSNDVLAEATVDTLGEIGGEEVVPRIVSALCSGTVPAVSCARALAKIYERSETWFSAGGLIERLAAAGMNADGIAHLVTALGTAPAADMSSLVCVMGWARNSAADVAIIALLDHPAAHTGAMDALVARGPDVVAALITAADGMSGDRARAALAVLGRIGSAAAVPRLIAALRESPDTAIVAAHALGSLGDHLAFEPLLELLDHEQDAVRQAAVSAINSIGNPGLHARVRQLIHHESVRVRESAARIAGYFGFDDCADELIAFCSSPDHTLRRAAIESTALLDDPRVTEVLRGALRDVAADVRAAAARAIGRLGVDAATELLREALAMPDPWVRYHAARSAGALVGAQVLRPLATQATSDPHPPARLAAIEALGRVGDPSITSTLAALADDVDPDIALAALDALGQTADVAARGTIVAALREGPTERSRVALKAIDRQHISFDATSDLADVAARTRDDALANSAIALLGNTPSSVDVLLELAHVPRIRAACVAALTQIARSDTARLIARINGAPAADRAAIVEALGRCDRPEAARHVALALEDVDADVRAQAGLALQRLDLRSTAA